jgi:MoaA/NifB/PqqE/SkfB family radical SAM enzyme
LQLSKKSSEWLEDHILNKVLNSDFEHLAVVGKEPLVNKEHIEKLIHLAKKIKESGRTISIITNGKNLNLAKQELLGNLDFIDISFDGGKETYEIFRRGDFEELKKQIQNIYNHGFKKINALHSVHSENINNIEDMMTILEIIPFGKIMFSPYLVTENFGENKVSKITLEKLFKKLSSSKSFMKSPQTIVNIDSYHLEQAKISPEELIDLAKKFGLKNKLVLHDKDLLPSGVVRVTYDGWVLSPSQSLNPKRYFKGLELKNFEDINEAWEILNS